MKNLIIAVMLVLGFSSVSSAFQTQQEKQEQKEYISNVLQCENEWMNNINHNDKALAEYNQDPKKTSRHIEEVCGKQVLLGNYPKK